MAEVVVLRAGYSRAEAAASTRAGCSISLVLGAGSGALLVDSGGPAERELLLQALAAQRLTPADVAYMVCTHGHIDHVGNANLFPGATFLSGQDRAVGDRFWPLDLGAGPVAIAAGVRVMATPGHTSEDISLLVETAEGLVAIAGDVFEHGDALDTAWRAYCRDVRVQQQSQAALLAIATRIVPGHGAPFGVADYLAGGEARP